MDLTEYHSVATPGDSMCRLYVIGKGHGHEDTYNFVEGTFFLSIDTESINFGHHFRCGGWLNFEFSKREKHEFVSLQRSVSSTETKIK